MRNILITLSLACAACPAIAQSPAEASPPSPYSGPPPTHANIAYAPAEPADGKGHLLDLYLPDAANPVPVVIWTSGSAWTLDSGKDTAAWLADPLNDAGMAVAGVSIRSSSQVIFPGQLHDIKAAIRWLRAHGAEYGIDPDRIAIMGSSSGGWTAAMAAVTGDVPELEAEVGTTGVSSAVQAAIAFYPPTRFTEMDNWAVKPCIPGLAIVGTRAGDAFCHDDADSPESLLIGCAIQECPEQALRADPIQYISVDDPPILILHGQSDAAVPHAQGEMLYQALNKACLDAVFISLPIAAHGPAPAFLGDKRLGEAATKRSTTSDQCMVNNPEPYAPNMHTLIEFLRDAFD